MKNNLIPFATPTLFKQAENNRERIKVATIAVCKVRFINYKSEVQNLPDTTTGSYEGEINRLIRFLPEGALTPITDVTHEVIEDYIAYANTKKRKWEDHPFNVHASVTKVGLQGSTVNNMRRNLSCFFNWLVDKKVISQSPVAGIEAVPEVKAGYGHTLEKAEIARLMKQPNQTTFNGYRDASLIQLLVDTAMRLGQCLQLRVDDIILDRNLIYVRPEITKTNIDRYVAITPGTAHMLRVLIESMSGITTPDFPWLWVTDQGTKLSSSTFSKQLKNYAVKAGLDPKRVHPHEFRHYSAIQHRMRGASVDQIQALLDHKSISTTMIYLERFKHDMREINDKYSPAHDLNKRPGRKCGPAKLQLAAGAEMSFSENIV